MYEKLKRQPDCEDMAHEAAFQVIVLVSLAFSWSAVVSPPGTIGFGMLQGFKRLSSDNPGGSPDLLPTLFQF